MLFEHKINTDKFKQRGIDLDYLLYGGDLYYMINTYAINEEKHFDEFISNEVKLHGIDKLQLPSLFINSEDDNICP